MLEVNLNGLDGQANRHELNLTAQIANPSSKVTLPTLTRL
jgi:hypothetical protein